MTGAAGPAIARRIRRTARIVLLDPAGRVLLFRYIAAGFPPFWILAGGECDPGEDYPAAARRELREETGIDACPVPTAHGREADYVYCGEPVRAIERFFLHRAASDRIDTSGHTELEREAMQEHRWFARAELAGWHETIYPADLADLLETIVRPQGDIAA
jgi:8-oxo-dGTP pyrophosphatase MutT (NUDIX family)